MTTTQTTNLDAALTEMEAARARMQAARHGSKAWRAAGADFDFWAGKVAALRVLAA